MVDENKTRPIVIKKVKKHAHGHHGGSWKIAFADFMTAMFAVFLVLWLLEALDDDQLQAVGSYFRDPTVLQQDPDGGMPTAVDLEGGADTPIELGDVPISTQEWSDVEELYDVSDEIYDAIMEDEALDEVRDQITMDLTEDGLRIQLIDREGRPMFARGSARLEPQAREILGVLAGVLQRLENPLSLSGHTDATGFRRDDYDNWNLSTDRAHSARFALRDAGIDADRFAQTVGYADTIPFDGDNPNAAVNRRISLLVMTREALETIAERERAKADDAGLERLDRPARELLTEEERQRRSPEPQERDQPEDRPEEGAGQQETPPQGEGGQQLLTPEEMQRGRN